ncbi:hypothetical protein F5884DRAFT_165910 [Xylogone sp. PMI_703]|nr:hypothetical protein F5884DRAFT_165910 [Xylogone sp. PMI_703]
MDTMDYTMNNPQPMLNPDANGPRSCPDLAQHESMAGVNGVMLQNRESHIYDPVHSTGPWYNSSPNPLQNRASLPIPNSQNYQQWPSSPPPPHASWNWPGVSRMHSRPMDFGSLDMRPQHYLGLPGAPPHWTSNHDPSAFNNYRPFTSNPLNNQSPATTTEGGRGPQQNFPSAAQTTPQIPPPFPIPNPHSLRSTRANSSSAYSNSRTASQRRVNDVTVDRGTRPSSMEGVEGQSPG